MKKSLTLLAAPVILCLSSKAQILYTNNANVTIAAGAVVWVNGGLNVSNSSTFTNDGDLTLTKNSTLPLAGSFNNESGSTVSGNGIYSVEQDWINSSTFNAGTSSVKLNGNTQQFITSNNNTATSFNNLELSGTGTGTNRKKTLQGVDATVGSNGILSINDRELETQTQTFFITNTLPAAVTNNTTPGSEGFVSSLNPGTFSRQTQANTIYIFPTGSSAGTLRYRPVELVPTNNSANTYVARLNNADASNQGFDRAQNDSTACDLNPLFFHSINRVSGTSSTDVRLFYITAQDGGWSGMAQWRTGNTKWNDMNAQGAGTAGTFDTRTRTGWNFVNPGDPYILTNMRPEAPVINCPSLCENSLNNTFTLNGNASSYQWTFPSNGSLVSGQGTGTVTADWSTGTSSVSAIAIGNNGCNSLPGFCVPTVLPPPSVQFTYTGELNDVSFTDQTNGSTTWSWNFGDGANSSQQNPTHTYPATGTYTVTLTATNAAGCSNTMTQVVETFEEIFIPNVISPNGDGINDMFTIKAGGVKNYELNIFNRWGTKVFTSTSNQVHWDGRINGNEVVDGVYFYTLKAETATKTSDFHGTVTVFK